MGLLDSIDPQILALLQGPTQDDAAAIKRHQLLTAGLAMMQNSYMNPVRAIGYGGQVGLQAGYEEQMRQAAERAARLGGFSQAMNLQNQLQQFSDNAATRQTLQQIYGNQGMPEANPQPETPTAQPSAAPPSAPPQAAPSGPWQPGMPVPPQPPSNYVMKTTGDGIPYMAPPDGTQVASNAPVSLPSAPAASPVPAKPQKYEQYQQIGDALAKKGLVLQAQQYYDMAEKYRPKPVGEPKEVSINGQRVMVQNYDSGPPQVMPYQPPQDKPEMKDTGNALQGFDPRTLQPVGTPIPKAVSPDAALSNAEQVRYHNLEMGIDANGNQTNYDKVAQQIANYDQPPLSSFAMGKPIGAAIMSKVAEINPAYDAKNYASAQQTLNAFSKGPEAQKVRSFNVALAHLDTLGQLTDALQNGNIPLVNKIGNVVSAQTGQPAVTNFTAAKAIVGNEIVKAIVGAGGGVEDRAKAQATLAAANSPQQLKGVIDTYKTLMGGQLGGLKQQYETATRRDDFNRFLSPEAQRYINKNNANTDLRSQADKIIQGN